MKIAIQISALSLLVALAATASASLSSAPQPPFGAHATVGNPDPSDCAFCGGNPALHIRRLVDLERVNMAVFSSLAR
jgi:hypothetical protein